VAALALTPVVRALPGGIEPEPVTYLLMSLLLVAIAVFACLVPALRVSSLNPATALRHD
jgi:ABC-type antimicrobial peptide transport system permease subunit